MFHIAIAVGIFAAEVWEYPYTVALLLVGLAVSVLEVITDRLAIDIRPSHDIIFLVLLDCSVTRPIHVRRYLREMVASAATFS